MRCSGKAKFVSGSTDGDAKRLKIAGVHRTHSGGKAVLRMCGFLLRVIPSTNGRAPKKGEALLIETDAMGWLVREPVDPGQRPCRERSRAVQKSASERSKKALVRAIPEVGKPMRLAHLRRLVNLSRPTFDAALGALHDEGAVVLYREDNPAALTPDDKNAAWYTGGQPRHIVYRTEKQLVPKKPKTIPRKQRKVFLADVKRGSQRAMRDFAFDVLLAAQHPKTARFGEDKAYIASVWRQFLGGDWPLPDFKSALVEANRLGYVQLSRADLVVAMDPDLVRKSETKHLNATFHFVDIPHSATLCQKSTERRG